MKVWKYTAASLCLAAMTAPSQTQQSSQPQVIFSRPQSQVESRTPQQAKAVAVTNAERNAVTFTAYDLDIHLTPRQSSLTINAHVTVRNDSEQPLTHLPLQLSSTLNFEQVAVDARALPFSQQTIKSDVDHTGELHEAVITLPAPLPPRQQLTLTVTYSGQTEQTAKRLEQIGTPADMASSSDWDRISEDFTGLRGFGDVAWYPVSSQPVLLGNGAELFTEIGRQKQRTAAATVKMRVTEEFFSDAPNFAALDGHALPLDAPRTMPTASFPGVITFSLPPSQIGFAPLSLFVAHRVERQGNGINVYAREADQGNAQGYLTSETMVGPLLSTWLGAKPRETLNILDLPEPEDGSFESNALLATGLAAAEPEKLGATVIHGLAHAAFSSPQAWLNEGVPVFMTTLWIEQGHGRVAALERLEAQRGALTLAEPGSPAAGEGEDLPHASDAIYYGTKAAYVLWMLRDLTSDKSLSAALRAYDPASDTEPGYFERLLEKTSGKDLKWFFDDWVYHDRGLPDLSIGGVYPASSSQADTYLVSIDIANEGYAAASVPVTVRSQSASQTERVLVPARSRVTHRMLIQGNPTEVQVNDGIVPEVGATIHRKSIKTAGEG